MYSLSLEWKHCSDGIELFDYGPEKEETIRVLGPRGRRHVTAARTGPAGKTFRCRSSRRFPVRFDIDTLENPVIIRFANARDDDNRIQFFARFGFPYRKDEYSRKDV